MYGTVSGNVFNRHTLNINTKKLRNYYNTGPIKVGSSINDYQAGNILVFTSNTIDNPVIGQIYINYKIKLHIPCYSNFRNSLLESSTLGTIHDSQEGGP